MPFAQVQATIPRVYSKQEFLHQVAAKEFFNYHFLKKNWSLMALSPPDHF